MPMHSVPVARRRPLKAGLAGGASLVTCPAAQAADHPAHGERVDLAWR